MDGNSWAVIITGALTLIGTVVTVSVGNSGTRKMILYRIEQLEKKVDKHNKLVERMYKVEERCSVLENEVKDLSKEAL